jgi:hypothetical protein
MRPTSDSSSSPRHLKSPASALHLTLNVLAFSVAFIAVHTPFPGTQATDNSDLNCRDGTLPSSPGHALVPRAPCKFASFPTRRTLCSYISRPASGSRLDIGSPNGRYALLWDGGNPRLVYRVREYGAVKVVWKLLKTPLKVPGCSKPAPSFGE